MSQPVNVVIPTRERADTLRHALATAVAQDIDRLVIWVSDNDSGPATREVVESFADPRIRYLNTGRRLSMAHNYEFALSHVEDGWIVMIGDDDGLLPGRLAPAIAELEASGLEALASETCFFNWPGAAPGEDVRLMVPLGQRSEVIRCEQAMERMLYLRDINFRMPQTYTGGIVHADLLRRIRAVDGQFFHSQIPDVYSGYAICSLGGAFLYTQKPFAIAGRSSHSIGAQLFAMKKDTFLEEGLIPFHADFPLDAVGTLTFSMPAMIFEAYTQAGYLRSDPPLISKAEMLAIMLAFPEPFTEQTFAFGRQFADRHGLDYEAALVDARRFRSAIGKEDVQRRMARLWNGARRYAGDGPEIATVADAAQVAAGILSAPPSRLLQFARGLVREATGRLDRRA